MCLYVSVLNIETSYLTSIHFKTSIPVRKEREKQRDRERIREEGEKERERGRNRGNLWVIVGVNRSLHFNYFVLTPLKAPEHCANNLACSLRGWFRIGTSLTTTDALFLICLSRDLSSIPSLYHLLSPLAVSLSSSESKYGSYFCSHSRHLSPLSLSALQSSWGNLLWCNERDTDRLLNISRTLTRTSFPRSPIIFHRCSSITKRTHHKPSSKAEKARKRGRGGGGGGERFWLWSSSESKVKTRLIPTSFYLFFKETARRCVCERGSVCEVLGFHCPPFLLRAVGNAGSQGGVGWGTGG